jgi:hypothetical protein
MEFYFLSYYHNLYLRECFYLIFSLLFEILEYIIFKIIEYSIEILIFIISV